MDFGNTFSSQVESISVNASFWLVDRPMDGIKRWMMAGKYPRRLENLNKFDVYLNLSLCEVVVSSKATIKPRSVTTRAVSFR